VDHLEPGVRAATQHRAGQFEVVYDRSNVVSGARVNGSTFALIDTNKILTDLGAAVPDVAFDGTNFLVVAHRTSSGTDIIGVRLTPGNVVLSTIFIETNAANQGFPRVSWDGTRYTVVYEDTRNYATKGIDIYGRQVDQFGIVSGAFVIATSTDHDFRPTVSPRNGTLNEVAYWRAGPNVGFDYSVWGQSLNNNLLVGAPFAISNATGIREMSPAIGCSTTLSCVAPYRWLNPADTATSSDRIKARVLSY